MNSTNHLHSISSVDTKTDILMYISISFQHLYYFDDCAGFSV